MSVINIIKLMMASTLTCMVYACDFTEKNIDPNSPTSIEPGPLLTYTQLHTTTGGIAKNIQVGTCMMLVQQAASLNNDMPGDKYYQMESYANTFFTDTYSDLIKLARIGRKSLVRCKKFQYPRCNKNLGRLSVPAFDRYIRQCSLF